MYSRPLPSEYLNDTDARKKFGRRTAAGMAALVVMGVSDAITMIAPNNGEDLRNKLPEPFDYFDHAGNFSGAIFAGWCVAGFFLLAGKMEGYSPRGRAKLAIGLGTAAVAATNYLTETKFGLSLTPGVSANPIPDSIDLAYGVIAGEVAVGTVTAFHFYNETYRTWPSPEPDELSTTDN